MYFSSSLHMFSRLCCSSNIFTPAGHSLLPPPLPVGKSSARLLTLRRSTLKNYESPFLYPSNVPLSFCLPRPTEAGRKRRQGPKSENDYPIPTGPWRGTGCLLRSIFSETSGSIQKSREVAESIFGRRLFLGKNWKSQVLFSPEVLDMERVSHRVRWFMG